VNALFLNHNKTVYTEFELVVYILLRKEIFKIENFFLTINAILIGAYNFIEMSYSFIILI